MAVNTVLAGGKMAAGIFGHSHALVADAVESMADIFSSLVVWRGVVVAAAPADEDHPYGHGKAEPIAAAFVSVLLLGAALWITLTAIREIREPHASPRPFTLLVLLAVIFIKENLFRFVLKEAGTVESTAVRSDAWHHRSDAITSLAAAVGIAIALIGGPAYAAADDWAALAAAVVIAFNGWRLLREALSELMDRSPSGEIQKRIIAIAESVTEVEEIEKCLVRKMGYNLYVEMHVQVNPGMTVLRSHEIAHWVKDAIRAQMPAVQDVLVHIEPAPQKSPPNSR